MSFLEYLWHGMMASPQLLWEWCEKKRNFRKLVFVLGLFFLDLHELAKARMLLFSIFFFFNFCRPKFRRCENWGLFQLARSASWPIYCRTVLSGIPQRHCWRAVSTDSECRHYQQDFVLQVLSLRKALCRPMEPGSSHAHPLGWKAFQVWVLPDGLHPQDHTDGASAHPHRWQAVQVPLVRHGVLVEELAREAPQGTQLEN